MLLKHLFVYLTAFSLLVGCDQIQGTSFSGQFEIRETTSSSVIEIMYDFRSNGTVKREGELSIFLPNTDVRASESLDTQGTYTKLGNTITVTLEGNDNKLIYTLEPNGDLIMVENNKRMKRL